ncbi:uncharacterized protein N7506_011577 [Penicillium brevicompactum]|uniref:uncharacterized protein n=1 Tax=Penicillium brevicompactum TaxID=5074 RepID=UPI00254094F5|nr:uncharacterized protein N7506_011577 [Penicillium brevicompactum]KAJ5318873.1 hypothetical protein N7506_011577 [Penicillium brevicompactum]
MDRLPIEMLVLIGDHIHDSEYRHGILLNLSLCCRHFHNVFQPMIYHFIGWCDPMMSVGFIRFIMRLWRQPELASKVRRLDIDWYDIDYHDSHECGPRPRKQPAIDKLKEDTNVVSFIQDALDEIFTPEEKGMRSEWEKHLDPNNLCTESWLGLLLVRTNNIQTIVFTHHESQLMSDILHKAANRQRPFHKATPFPHLQEVRGGAAWEKAWIDSDFFTPFFYFPAVRKIYVSVIGEDKYEGNMTLDKSYCSNQVREIIIDELYWSRDMLDWFEACTKLERVSVNIDIQEEKAIDEMPDHLKFDASLYRTGLLHSAATLKSLRINYGSLYRNRLEEHDALDAPFGSFRDFVVVEDIAVRHSHLMNTRPLVEILPISLKRLEINHLMDDDDDDLVHLISELSDLVHQGCCENLEQLLLQTDLDNGCPHLDALKLECEARGVFLGYSETED